MNPTRVATYASFTGLTKETPYPRKTHNLSSDQTRFETRALPKMDIRGARPPGPPTISIYDDDRYGSSQRFGSHGPFNPSFDRTFSPGGMGIPNAPSHENPPPALPPPRFVPVDGPQAHHHDFFERQRKESYNESFFGGRSESSGYGSWGKSRNTPDEFADYRRRESNTTLTGKDEGYSSLSSYASST